MYDPSFDTIWTFHTDNYSVIYSAAPDGDLDLSWDEDGEVADSLDRGVNVAFIARVEVLHRATGLVLGDLHGNIYSRPQDFCKGENRDGYFRDMVREAISSARETRAKLCAA